MLKKKNIFLASTIISLSLIGATTILTSCASVSARITNNMFNPNAEEFATADNQKYDWKSMVEKAIHEKGSQDKFKEVVVNHLLYGWFEGNKSRNKQWEEKWDVWQADAKKAYDDKINSYKTSHGADWPYYFRNEVLDPVGGTKDGFIKQQLYTSIRNWFNEQVFNTSYLGMAGDNNLYDGSDLNYDPAGAVDKNKTGLFSQNEDGIVTFETAKNWHKIDFFAHAKNGVDSAMQYGDEVWAQIQHYTFELYNNVKHPISTSMVLWKYTAPEDGLNTVYNEKLITGNATPAPATAAPEKKAATMAATEAPTTAPTAAPANSLSLSYQFPYFASAKEGEDPHGPNQKFYDMVFSKNGFKKLNAPDNKIAQDNLAPFGAADLSKLTNDGIVIDATNTNTGAIRIPTAYTDDSSCIFKVDLGDNAFSNLDVTYAGAASYLFNQAKAKVKASDDVTFNYLPKFNINPKSLGASGNVGDAYKSDANVDRNKANILENFLFPEAAVKYQPLVDKINYNGFTEQNFVFDLAKMYDSVNDNPNLSTANDVNSKNYYGAVESDPTKASFHSRLFANTKDGAKVNSRYYNEGYRWAIGAYQLAAKPTSTGTDETPLPYIFIREASGGTGGVHIIGLDCVNYLAAKNGGNYTENTVGLPFSAKRSGIVLKARALQTHTDKGDELEWKGSSGFDFTEKGKDLNNFYTSNVNDIILYIANQALSVSFPSAGGAKNENPREDERNMFCSKNFNITKTDNKFKEFGKIYNIVAKINTILMCSNIVTNFEAANKNIWKFTNTYTTNLTRGWYNSKTTGWISIYKNGLAAPYPFILNDYKAYDDTSKQFTKPEFDVTASIYNLHSPLPYDVPETPSADPWRDGISALSITDFTSISAVKTAINTLNGLLAKDVEDADNKIIKDLTTSIREGDYGQYSEHLLLKNNNGVTDETIGDAFNQMIWHFQATSSNYFNWIKSEALKRYLGTNGIAANTIIKDLDNELNATLPPTTEPTPKPEITKINCLNGVINNFIKPKVLTADNNLASIMFNNDISTNQITADNFKLALINAWKTQNDNYAFKNGISETAISWLNYKAALKYLTDDNCKYFVNWLRTKITPNTPAYIVFNVKNNINSDKEFEAKTDFANLFNFNANQLNQFNSSYLSKKAASFDMMDNTSTTVLQGVDIIKPASYVANDAAFSLANISNGGSQYENVAGYVGLNTPNMTNLPLNIKDALFKDIGESGVDGLKTDFNEGANVGYGSLLSLAPIRFKDSTNIGTSAKPIHMANVQSLSMFIATNNLSISTIESLSEKINGLLPKGVFEAANKLVHESKTIFGKENANADKKQATAKEKAAILIMALEDYKTIDNIAPGFITLLDNITAEKVYASEGDGSTGPAYKELDKNGVFNVLKTKINSDTARNAISDTDMKKYESIDGETTNFNIRPLVNPLSKTNNIYEGSGYLDKGTGVVNKVSYIPLNYAIVNAQDDTHALNYGTIMQNLYSILGEDILAQLICSAAADASNQSQALDEARRGYTVTVYDRRWNDALGKYWVVNYKQPN